MPLTSINPATGETLSTHAPFEPRTVRSILRAGHHAFLAWRGTSFAERAALMHAAAQVLRSRADELARLMALEMGKPLEAGRAEIEKCAVGCATYAEEAERMLRSEDIATEARRSFVSFEPLGVVLAVMPWNFPFWQVFRFAAPALMAGNTAVLKHASNVTGCALAIEDVFRAAGFPADVFRTLLLESRHMRSVIGDRHVAAVTLTGSTDAGRAVAQAAGKQLKKTVLELGGSDAYLVLADADLELAAKTCATSRLINSGQSCIAAKRFIVVEEVRAEFIAKLVAAMSEARFGDPLDAGTTHGPLARRDLRDELHAQVERSLAAGARCVLGGNVPDGPGAFYPATVLSDVRPGMAAFDEELFGPVAAVVSARDEEEAILLANRSAFGLGAAVFTRDLARGEAIATHRLEAGCCFVNDFVKSDPRLPFGGIKQSGYGRELSHYGIKEFVNIKTVVVK